MKRFGIFLAILGAGSFVLNLFEWEFRLLMWIDLWGPTIGNLIRIGLVVVGVVLLAVGIKQESAASESAVSAPQRGPEAGGPPPGPNP